MSLDRLTLRALYREITERVAGRRIDRVRSHGPSAITFELSSRQVLVSDVSRSAAGFWLVERGKLPADDRAVEGPSRNALLLFRKHLEGERIADVATADDRAGLLRCGPFRIRVQPYGGPGATLSETDAPMAHFGAAVVATTASGALEPFQEAEAADFVRGLASASLDERRARVAARDPGLLPLLRFWPASDAATDRLIALLRGSRPEPFLVEVADDASHTERPPGLLPFEPDRDSTRASDFVAGSSALYLALRRAALFQVRRQALASRARSECAKYERLTAALDRDRGRWPDPEELRRQAEALLAIEEREGATRVSPEILRVADPRVPGATLDVRVNPSLSPAQNANALLSLIHI